MGVYQNALAALTSASPNDKINAATRLNSEWAIETEIGTIPVSIPDRPARPASPKLVPPYEVRRRRLGSDAGRIALLHAVAHIEFNAIDLAADMICRFGHHTNIDEKDRLDFISNWVSVCSDESRHFLMLQNRLSDFGASYGDLPAHDGLWEAAQSTKDNIAARLAIAPMVLEARGLDVTPGMIEKLLRVGDTKSANLLGIIYEEEIPHVSFGAKWFNYMARTQDIAPEAYFQSLVRKYFKGPLKPPFNVKARDMAGLYARFYLPLAQ